MKKSKNAALLAAVFSAAMNMNACAYGPPPNGVGAPAPSKASVVSENESSDVSSEEQADVSAESVTETTEQQ